VVYSLITQLLPLNPPTVIFFVSEKKMRLLKKRVKKRERERDREGGGIFLFEDMFIYLFSPENLFYCNL
jgi:hypothetical protein